MTAQELFDLSLSLMGLTSTEAQINENIYFSNLNIILSQTFGLENVNREYKELDVLTTPQVVSALSDVLTYQDNVLKNVVVFGVAQLLAMNDDDYDKSGFFEQRYADGMNREDKTVSSDIVDYYSTESL